MGHFPESLGILLGMYSRNCIPWLLACLMCCLYPQNAAGQSPTPTPATDTFFTELRGRAEEGEKDAQYTLGAMYFIGEGMPKDATEAAKWFHRAAEQGHANAQGQLGALYAQGIGVPQDYVEAVKWARRAAEQGHAAAELLLGACYQAGWGVPQDYTEAAKWYRRAAEQGLAMAQFSVGVMYAKGEGVPKDATEAVKWSRRAAEQGHADAQYNLSGMYWSGEGVPTNHIQAYSWASLAAASGNLKAKERREILAKYMTREQVAEAQKIAAAFKPRPWKADDRDLEHPQPASTTIATTGSGFFVTPDGYFVTNHHVIADAVRIHVRTAAGTFPATVVRSDATNDVAILKVANNLGEFSALPIRGSRALKMADRVATLGYPNPEIQGQAAKYSSGEIAALSGPGDDPRFLQISVPIQPGNSGGPLVDSSGCVVGVIVAQLDKIFTLKVTGSLPENVNYAVKGTILLGVMEAVPGLADKVQSEPAKPPKKASEVIKSLEAACGLVLVER